MRTADPANLLWQQTCRRSEAFHRSDKWLHVSSSGKFKMRPLSREQRPGSALAPSPVRTAIFSLPITVVIVTMPHRSRRGVRFQHRVDHFQ